MRKRIIFTAGVFICHSPLMMAEERLPERCPIPAPNLFLPSDLAPDLGAVTVDADNAQFVEQGTSVFTGNVEVFRGGQQLNANRATYNQVTGKVTAQGDVRLRDSDMVIEADQVEWSTIEDKGSLIDAKYLIRESRARGEASHIFRQGTQQTDLKNATYTTCAEGDNAWLLQARDVDLNHETAVGSARNVVLRMGGWPVLYTPYITFPLNDERKSGFLIPSIGSSTKTGFDVSTPYYWNIAPNQDATLTPRYMSDRGMMLIGEYRYLIEQGEGLFDAGYLSQDRLRTDGDIQNPNYNDSRQHFSWQHQGRFSSRWRNYVDYNYVSDRNYLEDFSSNLNLSSTTHLNRLARVDYSGDIWRFGARVQGYQTLFEEVEKPYQRLPQLTLNGLLPNQAYGLTYELKSEMTAFDHDERVKGQRFDFEPAVSLPLGTAGFFATPRVALKTSYYNLDNLNQNPQFNQSSVSRTLPIISLDTGLFFERPLKFGNGNYTQTLEPRAFYLYIPYRNQDDIPVFDTNLRTFNMGSLFSYDRFTGPDRVGDANQLSLALTTRFIDERTGRDRLALTFGQIQYFSNREVGVVPDQPEDKSSDSDYIAEVIASITRKWTASGQLQWNPDNSRTSLSSVQLRYRGENGGVFNVAHRYRRINDTALFLNPNITGLEQVDISAALPINDTWSVIGRHYRSLDENRALETLAGLEYNSCCWSTRFVFRDYINNIASDDRNTAFYVEIQLKGLGSFGDRTDNLLQRSIVGYD